MQEQSCVSGVDVGGTFTDLILFDPGRREVHVDKRPTTPAAPEEGVLALLDRAPVAPAALDLLIHGTTVTTNALLERQLARVGLITTEGFRDVLELGRRTRPHAYGLMGSFTPLIPRDLRLGVPERMDAAGEVVVPLDHAAVETAARQLLAAGCEAVVVHFLHAYRNPAHERRAADLVRALWPNAFVTAAHELLSEPREYERGVAAAVNAGVRPVLDRYLARLRDGLAARGHSRDFLVMSGNGGTVSSRLAPREAARTVMSGPASGVIAAAAIAERAGLSEVVTYDMGGTSTDVGLISGGLPAVTQELELEHGLPIHVPLVDVHAVGAGGGSVAWIDAGGLLRIGPESAGSDPGPICYGRGGRRATISDANALLGRLDPRALNGIAHAVDLGLLRGAFETLGRPLGLDAVTAAEAVLAVANLRMADAIRTVSVGRGHDLRDCTLLAFGGAGPLHACEIAREMGIARVLVPARPGLVNALGCAVADLRHDAQATFNLRLDAVAAGDLAACLAEQEAAGRRALAAEAVTPDRVDVLRAADLQFVGQTHLLRVALEDAEPTPDALRELFRDAFQRRFQVELPTLEARLVTLSTTVIGRRARPDLTRLIDPEGREDAIAAARVGTRPVRFAGRWHDTPVLRRERLPLLTRLDGPAILEQLDATTVLPPGTRATGDPDGNLLVEVGGMA